MPRLGLGSSLTGGPAIDDFDNTGYLMVGDGAVEAETEGIKLNAGDMLVLPVSSTDNVSIDADQASQKVNINIIT